MSNRTVRRRGTDSSGRGIYASDYMWSWWKKHILADKNVKAFASRVTITQGAWMTKAGGGADASAGYHDKGGTFDLRVWNLTDAEVTALIKALRWHGAAAWLRNEQHGGFSDPHIHFVLGTDYDLASGASYQWSAYLSGGDGMGGSDYHWRPSPLHTKPPKLQPVKNFVQKGRELIRKGLKTLNKAEDRTVVDNKADDIREALKSMPKK